MYTRTYTTTQVQRISILRREIKVCQHLYEHENIDKARDRESGCTRARERPMDMCNYIHTIYTHIMYTYIHTHTYIQTHTYSSIHTHT